MYPMDSLVADYLAFWLVFFALLGMVVGSFLNVLIDRLPEGKSILRPGSHCEACGRHLAVRDLVPVFSYLWLKGRCRSCKAAIPRRLPLVEAGAGALFAFLLWHYGFSAELGIALFYGCLFLVVAVIDLERGLILNKLIYPGMVVALILSLALSDLDIVPSIGSAAGGGGLGLGLFLAIVIVSRGGMGFGDVKMAALIGLVVGLPPVLVAIFLAIIAGGLVAVALLLTRKRGRRQAIPFGPYLALSAIITLLYGSGIFDWYLNLF